MDFSHQNPESAIPGQSDLTMDNGDNIADDRLRTIQCALDWNQTLCRYFESRRQRLLDIIEPPTNDEEWPASSSSSSMLSHDFGQQRRQQTMFLTNNFLKPYLCDTKGLSAPALFNAEHDYVLEPAVQSLLASPRHPTPWTDQEGEIVLREVRNQYVFKRSRPLVKRLEELLALSNRTMEQVQEVNQINSQLALLKAKRDEPERFSADIDWLSVAKHLGEDNERSGDDCELYYNNRLHGSINTGQWTPAEDAILLSLVEQHGESDWDMIASQIGTGRLAWQCCARYQAQMSPSMKRSGQIVGEEAEQLHQLIKQCRTAAGNIDWKQVARIWEGRLLSQIRHFYNQSLRGSRGRRRVEWSPLEDKLLWAGVKYYGNNYSAIAKHFPSRDNRQVRERYIYHLSFQPDRLHGNWSTEEDQQLIELCSVFLKQDRKIDYAKINRDHFMLRTPHQLYSRFQMLRKQLPDDFHLKPCTMEQLLSIRKTRQIKKNKVFKPPRLPDDREELYAYMRNCSKRLGIAKDPQVKKEKETENEEQVKESEKDEENEEEETDDHSALMVLTSRPTEISDQYRQKTLDACFRLYYQLQPMAKMFRSKSVCHTELPLRTANIFYAVLSECLSRKTANEVPGETKPVSPLTMDTMRMFLLNSGAIFLNRNGQQPQIICAPNAVSTYGYSMLQLMLNALLIRSAETGSGENFDPVELAKEPEYQELYSVFGSIFAWPALLARANKADVEKLRSVVATVKRKTVEPLPASSLPARPSSGRPKKKCHQLKEGFAWQRSLQNAIINSTIQYEDLNIEPPPLAQPFWDQTTEPLSSMQDRVKRFISEIKNRMKHEWAEKERQRMKKEMDQSKRKVEKKIMPGPISQQQSVLETGKSKKETTTTTKTVPIRRSARLSIKASGSGGMMVATINRNMDSPTDNGKTITPD